MYEVFARKSPRIGTPVLSFSKTGSLVFNQTAARLLDANGVKHVLVMWDASARKIALQVSKDEKDVRAYTVRYNPKGNGASFSAKTFLDHAGINYAAAKKVPIAIDIAPAAEFLIETAIPASCFPAETPENKGDAS